MTKFDCFYDRISTRATKIGSFAMTMIRQPQKKDGWKENRLSRKTEVGIRIGQASDRERDESSPFGYSQSRSNAKARDVRAFPKSEPAAGPDGISGKAGMREDTTGIFCTILYQSNVEVTSRARELRDRRRNFFPVQSARLFSIKHCSCGSSF